MELKASGVKQNFQIGRIKYGLPVFLVGDDGVRFYVQFRAEVPYEDAPESKIRWSGQYRMFPSLHNFSSPKSKWKQAEIRVYSDSYNGVVKALRGYLKDKNII